MGNIENKINIKLKKKKNKNNKNQENELRYLSPLKIENKIEKKYDFFKKSGIKYIDYKDYNFLIKFLNMQGKIIPRRITGISLKNQKKLSKAIKRARHIAILPFITDELK